MSLPAPRGLEAVGAYQLLDDLGAAPWGALYRALDTRCDLPVLLKVVPPSHRSGEPEGASWEAALEATGILGRIYHRHLPALAEIAEDGEGGLLVAFGPDGRTLRELLDAEEPMAPAGRGEAAAIARWRPAAVAGRPIDAGLVADWGAQLADALAEAHGHGLVHGRVGEDEVIVTPAGEPVLAGFGLTRLAFEPAGPGLPAPEAPSAQEDVAALAALLLRLARAARLAGDDPVVRVLARAARPGSPPGEGLRASDLAEALRQARRAGGAPPAGATPPAELPAAAEARARGDRRAALLLLAAALLLVLMALGAGGLLVRHDPPAAPASASAALPGSPGLAAPIPR